jgi:protein TonB
MSHVLVVHGPEAETIRRMHRTGVAGTVSVHVLLVAGMIFVAQRANEPAPLVYAVNLVAAPAPGPAPRRAVETATPTAPPEEAPPERARETAPTPPREAPRQPVREDPTLPTKSAVAPLPNERPSTGSDQLTFRQEGLRFPYPEYLENIVTQIRKRWVNPTGPGLRLRAEVAFTIHRDGTVTDIQYIRQSGQLLFDSNALGAVERAARDGAFGQLPSGWNGESLPISFSFTPDDR